MSRRTVALFGGSGLVGGYVLQRLLDAPEVVRVVAIGRRPLELSHPKLTQISADFRRLGTVIDLPPLDDGYCCLGTTIKKAGSREAFAEVDLSYVVEAARLARRFGATQWLTVSAMGANARSRVFYNRVKGAMERALSDQAWPHLQILRPALLLGPRTEMRLGERLAAMPLRLLAPLMIGPLAAGRPIHADAVAAAMVTIARNRPPGTNIFPSDHLAHIARGGEVRPRPAR